MSEEKLTLDTAPRTSKGSLLLRILLYEVFVAVLLFALAGTLRWLWGWIFLVVFGIVNLASVLLVEVDEELAEERTTMKADVKSWDKFLGGAGSSLFPFSFLIVGGLDYRFGWSGEETFPLWLKITSIVVGLLGYGFSLWAARENKFYARYVRIQKERGHHTISTGPYHIVRHPGYAGLIWFVFAAAVMLESIWALIPSGIIVLLLVIRTALEDKTLQEELEGYQDYTHQTRYRLLPKIW
ncbi:MAG: isoprenylcysteine carboxylmethyltransferase family protein [Anaerolineales bacterium]